MLYLFLSILVLFVYLSMKGVYSAGAIFLGLYALSLILGYLGFIVFDFAYGMPFQFGDSLTPSQFGKANQVFFLCILSFAAGALMVGRLPVNQATSITKLPQRPAGLLLLRKSSLMVFVAFAFAALLLVSSYGVNDLLVRDDYLPVSIERALKSVGILLAPAVLIAAHLLRLRPTSVAVIYAVFFLLFFAMGSRALVLMPAAFLISRVIGSNLRPKHIMTSGLASVLLVSIALTVRGEDTHGLIPYTAAIFSSGMQFDFLLLAVNYATAFSYSLSAYLLATIDYQWSSFLISVDPRLGGMAGWPEIADSLRVNKHAPYNAISELFALNPVVGCTYFFVAGVLISLCEKYSINRSSVLTFIILVATLFFTFYSLQYNLRSTTRILYYLLFVVFVYGGLRAVAISLASSIRASARPSAPTATRRSTPSAPQSI